MGGMAILMMVAAAVTFSGAVWFGYVAVAFYERTNLQLKVLLDLANSTIQRQNEDFGFLSARITVNREALGARLDRMNRRLYECGRRTGKHPTFYSRRRL